MSRLRRSQNLLRLAVVLLALPLSLALAAGCGTGTTATESFAIEAIGENGGEIQAGDVLLVIPPGALQQDTGVVIMPQGTPLPIAPPLQDPCQYGYLGPIWCCGPVGQELAAAGRMRLHYDEALIPAGKTEADLVLLLWDNAAGVMRPVTAQVVHDTVANYFEAVLYMQLGHVAVGVKDCPVQVLPPVIILGLQQNPPVLAASDPLPSGLYGAQPDNSVGPQQFATDGAVPDAFVPSPDGTRVLFHLYLPSEDEILRTSLIPDGPAATVVDETHDIDGGDPFFGWLRADGQVFFHEFFFGSSAAKAAALNGMCLSRASADGSTPPVGFYFEGATVFPQDMRQSDDGSAILLKLSDFLMQGLERIDVIRTSDAFVHSTGVIPVGGGQQSPRFVPDSTDVYLIENDIQTVNRYTAQGTFVDTIFSVVTGTIKDFVLGPDGERFAAVLNGFSPTGAADVLAVGTLTAGVVGTPTPLGRSGFYEEMVFHPDGLRVYLDYGSGVQVFRSSDAFELPGLPVRGMYDVDVEQGTGRLLVRVEPPVILATGPDASTALVPPPALTPGLYSAAADGTGYAQIDSGGLNVSAARWRTSWRLTPGMIFVRKVR